MELLVFSDTHGSSRRMLEVLEQRAGQTHAVIFLGDGERDTQPLAQKYPKLPLYQVAGNCDFGSFTPTAGLAAFGGVLFFYTHGHEQGVKGGLSTLLQEAKSRGADAALYGHSHMAHYENRGGIHLFNPGSLNIPRGGPPSYGLIRIQNKTPQFHVVEFPV